MKDASVAYEVDGATHTAYKLTPVKGLVVLGGVFVVSAAFIALSHALGIVETWVGFLFLTYWGGIEQMKFEKVVNCIVGATVGLAFAYVAHALPLLIGTAGVVLVIAAIVALVYCLIMGWFPVAVNVMAMLFLTVCTIPWIQVKADFFSLLVALALGVAYFVGLVALGGLLKQRSVGKA